MTVNFAYWDISIGSCMEALGNYFIFSFTSQRLMYKKTFYPSPLNGVKFKILTIILRCFEVILHNYNIFHREQ